MKKLFKNPIFLVLLTPLTTYSQAGDGPVYNFNFFNKGSIPNNSVKIPEGIQPANATAPAVTTTTQPPVTVPLAPTQHIEKPIEKDGSTINFSSFGVFYGYSESNLDRSQKTSIGNQHVNMNIHEIGFKKCFEKGLSISPKYLFGNINSKFKPETADKNSPYSQDYKGSARGYGIDIDQNLFKSDSLNLSLGASYHSISANMNNKNGPGYTVRYFGNQALLSDTISSYKLKSDSILATLKPKIMFTKNLELDLMGGFGTSKTSDIDNHKYSSKIYKYGATLAVNF